jgi:hypothetical protein
MMIIYLLLLILININAQPSLRNLFNVIWLPAAARSIDVLNIFMTYVALHVRAKFR